MKKIMMIMACIAMFLVSCSKGLDSKINDFDAAVADYEKLVEAGKTGDELAEAEKKIEAMAKEFENVSEKEVTQEQQMKLMGISLRYAGAKMKAEVGDLGDLTESTEGLEEATDELEDALEEEVEEEVEEDEE